MQDLLAKANAEVLAQFSWSKVVLAFDYDGTLAPIVDLPKDAKLRARTRALLTAACRVYPCIVISGRAQADVLKRLRGVGVLEVIGNHGLEPWRDSQQLEQQVQRWVPSLRSALAAHRGVVVEDKVYSLAIHYRQSREKRAAREAILAAAARLGPLRVVGGKQVVNLLPEGAPHKGIALTAARDRLGCDTAIYVGDDETDEDVFALREPGRLLAVRVGEKQSSSAPYFIRSQRAVDDLLQELLDLRSGPERRASAGGA